MLQVKWENSWYGGSYPPFLDHPPVLWFPCFKKSKMYPPFIILSGGEKYWKTFLTELHTISTSNFYNCIIISNVVKCKPGRMSLNVFLSILWKMGAIYRTKYKTYILESVACTAITETLTCILQQKQLCTAESTTCIIATKTPTCINTIKIVTHMFNVFSF